MIYLDKMSIYEPSEDSYLLQKILKEKIPNLLKRNSQLKVLEIGSGSGVQLVILQQLGVKNIFSSDINPHAVEQCTKLGFNCIKSDLFFNIKSKDKYDIIIFNPPYLPEDKREPAESKLATNGGKTGSEIINKFLQQAKDFLKKDGKIFLITSNLTKGIKWLNYKKKLLGEEKLFFEKLFVWELRI